MNIRKFPPNVVIALKATNIHSCQNLNNVYTKSALFLKYVHSNLLLSSIEHYLASDFKLQILIILNRTLCINYPTLFSYFLGLFFWQVFGFVDFELS